MDKVCEECCESCQAECNQEAGSCVDTNDPDDCAMFKLHGLKTALEVTFGCGADYEANDMVFEHEGCRATCLEMLKLNGLSTAHMSCGDVDVQAGSCVDTNDPDDCAMFKLHGLKTALEVT